MIRTERAFHVEIVRSQSVNEEYSSIERIWLSNFARGYSRMLAIRSKMFAKRLTHARTSKYTYVDPV